MLVLGALCSFLEPFRGRLSPNIDNVSEKLTLRYPHEGPWVERAVRRVMYAKRHLPELQQPSSGSNVIPRRARPGLADPRPHSGGG